MMTNEELNRHRKNIEKEIELQVIKDKEFSSSDIGNIYTIKVQCIPFIYGEEFIVDGYKFSYVLYQSESPLAKEAIKHGLRTIDIKLIEIDFVSRMEIKDYSKASMKELCNEFPELHVIRTFINYESVGIMTNFENKKGKEQYIEASRIVMNINLFKLGLPISAHERVLKIFDETVIIKED